MPLPTNLNTNEVRNASGTEQEFLFHKDGDNSREWRKSGGSPSLIESLLVQHEEVGKLANLQRRSNFKTKLTFLSETDSVTMKDIVISTTVLVPSGHLSSMTKVILAAAYHGSALSGNGTVNVLTYDGSGTLFNSLIYGTR
jgi:hypothetical protein